MSQLPHLKAQSSWSICNFATGQQALLCIWKEEVVPEPSVGGEASAPAEGGAGIDPSLVGAARELTFLCCSPQILVTTLRGAESKQILPLAGYLSEQLRPTMLELSHGPEGFTPPFSERFAILGHMWRCLSTTPYFVLEHHSLFCA